MSIFEYVSPTLSASQTPFEWSTYHLNQFYTLSLLFKKRLATVDHTTYYVYTLTLLCSVS